MGQGFIDFLWELRQVMQALADEPVEESSGLVKPRTRTQITYLTHPREIITHPRIAITHPKRSYADVEHEIANNLASPAKPFIARAKIGTNEYTIQALPFRTPDADHIWLARQKRIIEQTQRNYCKEQNYIKSEIKTRQEELMRKALKKPQATMDEDEEEN